MGNLTAAQALLKHSTRPLSRNCHLCVLHSQSCDQLSWQKCLAVDCGCSCLSHRPGYKTAQLNAKAPNARTATSRILFVLCTVGCAGTPGALQAGRFVGLSIFGSPLSIWVMPTFFVPLFTSLLIPSFVPVPACLS